MSALSGISCVTSGAEVRAGYSDIILLPEYSPRREIARVSAKYPNSIVIGGYKQATIVGGDIIYRSRAVLTHRGRGWIDYVKVGTDGWTIGSGDRWQRPVYQFGNMCIGVLICMDIDDLFAADVINTVRASPAPLKLICVPAQMQAHWFSSELCSQGQRFLGVHVVLCNSTKVLDNRRKSFITDTDGRWIVQQQTAEPIYYRFS